MFKHPLKKALQNGQTVFGTFVTCDSPDFVEILGITGFDFVIFDTEHGPLSVETAQNLMRAAELRGLAPIVRVTEGSETTLLRSLDIGAQGIQVPQVNDPAAARAIVTHAKYFPDGSRGMALARSASYGAVDPLRYFQQSNEETLIIAHCENKQGLDNLEAIAATPGIDVIFLGPFDMSQSLGIPGQVQHPLIQDAARRIVQTAKAAGKAAGVFAGNGEQARQRAAEGFQYIAVGLDITLFTTACKQELAAARG